MDRNRTRLWQGLGTSKRTVPAPASAPAPRSLYSWQTARATSVFLSSLFVLGVSGGAGRATGANETKPLPAVAPAVSKSAAPAGRATSGGGQAGRDLVAQSGVKLLEEILNRTHNIPQFARAKAQRTLAYQNRYNGVGMQGGPTNMLLAIKPKEPTMNLAHGNVYGGGGGGGDANDNSAGQYSPALSNTKGLVVWNNSNAVAKSSANAEVGMTPATTPAQVPIGQDKPVIHDFREAPRDATAGAVPGKSKMYPGDGQARLANSLGHLAATAGRMNQAVQQASQAESAAPPPPPALSGVREGESGQGAQNQNSSISRQKAAYFAGSNALDVTKNTGLTSYRRGLLNGQSFKTKKSEMLAASAPASAPALAGKSGSAGGATVEELKGARAEYSATLGSASNGVTEHNGTDTVRRNAPGLKPDGTVDERITFSQPTVFTRLKNWLTPDDHPAGARPGALGSAQVALLPPNIVSGIPFVRLGSSSYEVSKALSRIGTISKQTVNGWSVWTVTRSHSKVPSLYIYMRHGLVEAMRIFDPTLVTADFGMKLGDDLPAVLKRFGQPGFIIFEPAHSANHPADRHYVYPISQVSFQLSRSGRVPEPRVVSLLIFTVK